MTGKVSRSVRIKRFLRRVPWIRRHWSLRVLYTRAGLERLEREFRELQNEYDRLKAAGPEVREEFRREHPRVSSELHIRELIAFRASRLKQDLNYRRICLAYARKHTE